MSGNRGRLIHLDMLRGLAALGVVVGHVRGFVVVPYAMSPSDTLGVQLFYFVTSLGHQCVLAFFALSGFLVGGQALRNILAGQWSWVQYILRRLTRLWTVLLPALLLTWIFDVAGQRSAGPAGYEGAYFSLIASGPQTDAPADLSLATLLANAFFMQTIIAPVFGSNGPLWSLANEFWYYLLFPLVADAIIGWRPAAARVVLGFTGLVIAVMLPIEMLLLGAIWVAGVIGSHVATRRSQRLMLRLPTWLTITGTALAAALFYEKLRPGLSADLVLGVAFASMLPILAALPPFGLVYNRVADGLASISYTLYATHFPLLAAIWFVIFAPAKLPFGLHSFMLVLFMATAAIGVAIVTWWLFERNTDRIRKAVASVFVISRRRSPAQWWKP